MFTLPGDGIVVSEVTIVAKIHRQYRDFFFNLEHLFFLIMEVVSSQCVKGLLCSQLKVFVMYKKESHNWS